MKYDYSILFYSRAIVIQILLHLEAPIERQLIAVGQAPKSDAVTGWTQGKKTERVYYARRVLSVQQSQFSLARNTPTTFPVTFRLLPSGETAHAGMEYGVIIDRPTLTV